MFLYGSSIRIELIEECPRDAEQRAPRVRVIDRL